MYNYTNVGGLTSDLSQTETDLVQRDGIVSLLSAEEFYGDITAFEPEIGRHPKL